MSTSPKNNASASHPTAPHPASSQKATSRNTPHPTNHLRTFTYAPPALSSPSSFSRPPQKQKPSPSTTSQTIHHSRKASDFFRPGVITTFNSTGRHHTSTFAIDIPTPLLHFSHKRHIPFLQPQAPLIPHIRLPHIFSIGRSSSKKVKPRLGNVNLRSE
jgi:hypothetical protein